jgi:hypothetical protein
MRRHYFLFICALCLLQLASAQPVSEALSKDSVEYLTPEEYAMMLDRNDRFLIRSSLISAGVEWEFIKNFSILGQVGLTEDLWEGEFAKAELRYYLPLKSFSKSNLNGPYVSLGAKKYNTSNTYSSIGPVGLFKFDELNASIFYANLGLQRRFLGNGLADFGLRFGYKEQTIYSFPNGVSQEYKVTSFLLESKTSIGLGLTFKRSADLDYDRLCPVLKCYDTERFLLKINVAEALSFEVDERSMLFRTSPSVALEQKIGDLPYSAQFKVSLDHMTYTGRAQSSFNGTNFTSIYFDFESRYYYNLNARKRSGKTGNSLSANYFALGYSHIRDSGAGGDGENAYIENLNGFYITSGLQRTFGKRLYFDLYMGTRYIIDDGYGFMIMSGANVGIRF